MDSTEYLQARAMRKNYAELPGVGEFSLKASCHHPLCPSADDR